MKKFIVFLLCLCCIISNCFIVLASSDSFVSKGTSHSEGLDSVSSAWEYSKIYQNGNIDNLSYVVRYTDIGSRYALKFSLFDNNCILVRGQSSQYQNLWYFYVYKYDGTKMIQCDFLGEINFEKNYISCSDTNFSYCYVTKTYGCSFDNATDSYEVAKGVPIATSVENALLYYQTMDTSYLENGDDFVSVPEPDTLTPFYDLENNSVVMKYTSPEVEDSGGLYNAFNCTFYYTDEDGNEIPYKSYANSLYNYRTSGSLKVPLEFLDDYDNSFFIFAFHNEYHFGSNVTYSQKSIRIKYDGSDMYYIDNDYYNLGPDVPEWEEYYIESYVKPDYDKENNGLLGDIIGHIKDIGDSFTDSIFGLGESLGSSIGDLSTKISDLPSAIWNLFETGFEKLFVPDEEFIQENFTSWQQLLSDRFGAIYQCYDYLFRFVKQFVYQEAATTLTFPIVTVPIVDSEYTFGGYEVKLVPEGFSGIVDILKGLISLVCTIAFVNTMKNKFVELLGGYNDVE